MPTKPQPPVKASKPARGAISLPESDLFGNQLAEGGTPLQLSWDQIEPDPNQARWVLPVELRAKFIAGKLSAMEAMRQWQKQVERSQARAGKAPLKPSEASEARKLDEIAALARSLQAGGQVNPITVARHGGRWRIETGERRFWAHVYLVSVLADDTAAQIPVAVRAQIDPFRQAVENLHAAPLNAVGLAREIARLLMTALPHLYPAPGPEAPLDWPLYRQVAEQRVPPGGWSRIEDAMGRKADQLGRFLRLLLLPAEALALADRHDLTEKQLRAVSELGDPARQTRAVSLITELGLSSTEVEWLCQQTDWEAAERDLRAQRVGMWPTATTSPRARFAPEQVLYKRLVSLQRFTESVRRGGSEPAEALAEQLQLQASPTALPELRALIELLETTAAKLERSLKPSGGKASLGTVGAKKKLD